MPGKVASGRAEGARGLLVLCENTCWPEAWVSTRGSRHNSCPLLSVVSPCRSWLLKAWVRNGEVFQPLPSREPARSLLIKCSTGLCGQCDLCTVLPWLGSTVESGFWLPLIINHCHRDPIADLGKAHIISCWPWPLGTVTPNSTHGGGGRGV